MLTRNNNVVVVDDAIYKFLIDFDSKDETDDYRSFVNKVLSSSIMKKKFILLQGLQRKINRFDEIDGALDILATKIKENADSYTPEQVFEFYQILSRVYNNDVMQLRILCQEMLKSLSDGNKDMRSK